nr:putative uncharacterized protein DDB_G0285119 [Ciona intestinalis]|eukprot:XP_009859942.1 putative uncharacterized protein DDB_G0285119 [Ciona intestinalis]
MDESASQSMTDVEVGWDCGSPTPTAWKRYQLPCSGPKHGRKTTPDYKSKPAHKKPKVLHDENTKSYEIARKLISELSKYKNNNVEPTINSSMDLVFEMSGQGEDLPSSVPTTQNTSPLLNIPQMDDAALSDDDLFDESMLRHADDIMEAYKNPNSQTKNTTSTPVRDVPVNHVESSNQSKIVNYKAGMSAVKHLKPNALLPCKSSSTTVTVEIKQTENLQNRHISPVQDITNSAATCMNLFMSNSSQKTKKPPSKFKKMSQKKTKFQQDTKVVSDVSIPEDVLALLDMDDSWVEETKPSVPMNKEDRLNSNLEKQPQSNQTSQSKINPTASICKNNGNNTKAPFNPFQNKVSEKNSAGTFNPFQCKENTKSNATVNKTVNSSQNDTKGSGRKGGQKNETFNPFLTKVPAKMSSPANNTFNPSHNGNKVSASKSRRAVNTFNPFQTKVPSKSISPLNGNKVSLNNNSATTPMFVPNLKPKTVAAKKTTTISDPKTEWVQKIKNIHNNMRENDTRKPAMKENKKQQPQTSNFKAWQSIQDTKTNGRVAPQKTSIIRSEQSSMAKKWDPVVKTNNHETNMNSDDDELLLQAVMLTEAEMEKVKGETKMGPIKPKMVQPILSGKFVSPPSANSSQGRCTASEIERKKRLAMQRRLIRQQQRKR